MPGTGSILPDTLSRLYELDDATKLGEDKAAPNHVLNSRAAAKETFPKLDSGEYFTPPDAEERKLLLLREHVKGHFGSDAIYRSLRRKGIYWTNLKNEATELVKQCIPCQMHTVRRDGFHPLRPIVAKLPDDH